MCNLELKRRERIVDGRYPESKRVFNFLVRLTELLVQWMNSVTNNVRDQI